MRYNKAVLAGHFVISFDRVINGFLAVVMAPLFFEVTDNKILQLLSSYAAFAALYITGPLGAIFFGRIGDKIGRKKALLLSILGFAVPVFLIGICPTYKTIGFAAPVLLIFLRLIQGFFDGSEYPGVLIHNYEIGNKKVSSSANIISWGGLGGLTGALICWGITQGDMPSWSWRIPFLVGGGLAFVVYIFRTRIPETEDFIVILEKHQVLSTPIKELFSKYRLEMMVSILVCAAYSSFMYSSMMFGNRLFQQAGYTVSQSMLFCVVNLLWNSIALTIFGKLAECIGMTKQIRISLVSIMIIALPVSRLISGEMTIWNIYAYMFIISSLGTLILSCSANYVMKLFPSSCRYSGFAITDSIGSIAGGFTPFMMLLFSELFGTNLACSIWFYIIALPTLALITIMERKKELQAHSIDA